MKAQEDRETSCRVLVDRVSNIHFNSLRPLLVEDFFTKCQSLPIELKFNYVIQILKEYLPPNIFSLLRRIAPVESPPVQIQAGTQVQTVTEPVIEARPENRVDVAIIAVVPNELLALKIALGIDPKQTEDYQDNGFPYWTTEISCTPPKPSMKILLTMVGEPRNTPCALACANLFKLYKVGICMLVGIAAGLKDKIKLGQVVVGEMVLDYEGQRLEVTGAKIRPMQYHLKRSLQRDFQNFRPDEQTLKQTFGDFLSRLPNGYNLSPEIREFTPAYSTGVILSGEKLLADGTLPELRKTYHDKVRALEMEGSGFARACEQYSVPWMIFRGISDYGDGDKGDEWQVPSALAAATCALLFLKSEYRKQEITEF